MKIALDAANRFDGEEFEDVGLAISALVALLLASRPKNKSASEAMEEIAEAALSMERAGVIQVYKREDRH
jgi:hypothetical protein